MTNGRRRAWGGLAALGLALYAVFLIATLPAAWVASALEHCGCGVVTLRDPQGSAWSGRARLVAVSDGARRDIMPVTWEIKPLWLLAGRLRVDLASAGGMTSLQARLELAPRSLTVSDLVLESPAALISAFYAPAALVSPEGRLRAQSARLEIGPGKIAGEASLTWSAARIGPVRQREIGDYRLDVRGVGERADLSLTTLRGDLRLAGQGSWTPTAQGGTLVARGTAGLSAARADLEPVLAFLGAADGSGQRAFSISLPLPPRRARGPGPGATRE
jgi:general secretion pathway protein N